jgi:hypothetical protein
VTRRLAAGAVALVLALVAEPVRATRPLDTDDTETQDPGTASLELGADSLRTGGAHTVVSGSSGTGARAREIFDGHSAWAYFRGT